MTRELEGDAEISEEEVDGATDQQRDGMADMMSRILSQKIDGVSKNVRTSSSYRVLIST